MPIDHPGVSYVMPILNEADYVEAAIESIMLQEYSGPVELVLALAPSTDGTAEIVGRLARSDERIRVVDNDDIDIPAGLNCAIAAARHPVIVRVDAHTQLSVGYTARGVETLRRTGAANLGGIMVATGEPGFQAAVARAYNSPFGLGGGAYHAEDAVEGPAESAYMGIMLADAVRDVGGYDESVRRGEDWELCYRLRQGGHLVWLDPRLKVSYWPRDNWPDLCRQFYATGVWRGELARRPGIRNSVRFFAPPALVIAVLLSLVVASVHAAGVITGPWGVVAWMLYAGPIAYAILLILVGMRSTGSVLDRMRLVAVFATMHLVWGFGFIRGVLHGARSAVDTSRA